MKLNRKFQMVFSAVLILALSMGLAPGSAKAYGTGTTYYVRPDGNDACDGKTNVSGVSGNCAKRSIAGALADASDGDIIFVNNGGQQWGITLSSPVVIDKGVQIILGRNVSLNIGNQAEGCFVVAANGVRISAEVNQNGSCNAPLNSETASRLIYVNSGVSNLIIDGLYLAGSGYSSDVGIYFAGPITNLQILNNYFSLLFYGRDLQFVATPDGSVIDIKGNLFDGAYSGSVLLPANSSSIDLNYNSWGNYAGPQGSDITAMHGASYANYTYAQPAFDFGEHSPSMAVIGDDFTLSVKLDAVRLTGAKVSLFFPSDLMTYTSSSLTGTDFNTDSSLDTSGSGNGYLSFHGLTKFDAESSTYTPLTKSKAFVFSATFHVIKSGTAYLISSWNFFTTNTAGPSNMVSASEVQDTMAIVDKGTVTGAVSMQGRLARDGVYAELWQLTGQTLTSVRHDTSIDQMSGNYSYAEVVDGTYVLSYTKPGYLDITTSLNKIATFSPGYRTIRPLELKGGDADDNNVINISDAELIGSDYGSAGRNTPGTAYTDINSSGLVDIYDLALMGGNYGVNSTMAYSGW